MDNKAALKKDTYEAFARRLNDACDAAGLPPFKGGRQSTIKEQVGVSAEAVRRWFSAESMPRGGMVVALARVLKVDPSWLAYGASDDNSTPDARPVDSGAAANFVAALMQFDGASVAFTPGSDADFVAIRKGVQFRVAVTLGRATKDGVQFEAPFESEALTVVGVVLDGDSPRAVHLDRDALAAGTVRNAKRRVDARRAAGGALDVGGRALAPVRAVGAFDGIVREMAS